MKMKKDLLHCLKVLYDPNISLIDMPIMDGSLQVGAEISLKLGSGEIIASGCGELKETALRICIAEAFERGLVMKINLDSKMKEAFHIDRNPTTCGFAAGFESEKTKYRAVAEGLERWAWSQWIDKKCALELSSLDKNKLNNLSKIFLSGFIDFNCYKKVFDLTIDGTNQNFELFIFLGFTKDGIFPGSRVTINGDPEENWNHSILEAHRCLKNFKLNSNIDLYQDDIIAHRAIYFGRNKDLALKQIHASQQTNNLWPRPSIALLKEYTKYKINIYLWRCLMNDYQGWHIGDEKRFVY